MWETEHREPLPLAKYRDSIHGHNSRSVREPKARRHTNYVQWCGCITAIVLILAVLMLVLNFTVFRFKDPVLRLNKLTMTGLDRASNASTMPPGTVVTVTADVSIKNPNVGNFKFNKASIFVFYGDVVVGEGGNPSGTAKAKGTFRMNATIVFQMDKIFDMPRFANDSRAGFLPMSSLSSVSGKVNMLNVMKRSFLVNLGCTMTYNISSKHTQDEACNGFVAL